MNIRRGLLRLWVAGSFLWMLGVAALGYDRIAQDTYFAPPLELPFHFVPFVPVLCGDARGAAGKDYSTKEAQNPGPWDIYAKPNPFDTCWYAMPVYRKLWPEHKDLSDDAIVQKSYKVTGRELNVIDPLAGTKQVAVFAFGPPAALLFLGLLAAWVVSGFARPKKPPLAH